MNAGTTKIPVGTRVKIISKEDNGLIGKVTHPFAFGCTKAGWIGLYLEQDGVYTDNRMNVHISDIEIISQEEYKHNTIQL